MELEEFKTLWSHYDKKLDRALRFNAEMMRSLTLGKVQSALKRLVVYRSAEAFVAFTFTVLLAMFIEGNISEWALAASGLILFAFTVVGLAGNIQQIVFLSRLDYDAPIIILQKQLVHIRSHALLHARIAALLFPLYMAYLTVGFKVLWDVNIVETRDSAWLATQAAISLVFLAAVVWLWRTVTHENMHIAWVRVAIRQIGGESLASALALLGEIEKFEREDEVFAQEA